VGPYRNPFAQKNEIEKILQELLEVVFTDPSNSPYSSRVVIVMKKEGYWPRCPNLHSLNKLIIKDKFPSHLLMIFWMRFTIPISSLNWTFA
jgi:hypothetical protein